MENSQINDDDNSYLMKVYLTLSIMIGFTIAVIGSHYSRQTVPIVNTGARLSTNIVQDQQDAAMARDQANRDAKAPAAQQVKITDASLRKVSISAKNLLLEQKDGAYTFNTDMLEFIRTIRNKYRVYLLVNMDEGYTKETLEEIKELLQKLVKQDIIKGKQRLMYSSTETGHIAQIRHLASDLHLEYDFKIVKNLSNFMNKFHLIQHSPQTEEVKAEIKAFVASNPKKINYFEDISSYTSKIKNALAK